MLGLLVLDYSVIAHLNTDFCSDFLIVSNQVLYVTCKEISDQLNETLSQSSA